ncbi:hypothetical protein [Saccharopolyspora spinosa]|uniref:Uncharacterized protein n=1 Tax=Saccharopolyspora spinosa TaxID=60894 RepID=A0A2N3XYU4_SACSN|nr:hypothetical protein [Saccharopolyspora spinosa]PKW15855.1 hypothetical protein A8926_3631 [Saccharopolyspora spinosa]
MRRTTLRTGSVAGLCATAIPTASAAAGFVVVRPPATDRHWAPLTPEKWEFTAGQVLMTDRGVPPEGPCRPFQYAIVRKGPESGSLSLTGEIRIDEPVTRNGRDVVLIFNFQSRTRFYYAHLSQDNTIYPHHGIFVVDDADRGPHRRPVGRHHRRPTHHRRHRLARRPPRLPRRDG